MHLPPYAQFLAVALMVAATALSPTVAAAQAEDDPRTPLYIRLEDGTQCVFAGGATTTVLNQRANFACGDPGPNKWLLGSPDQYGNIAYAIWSEGIDDPPQEVGIEHHVTVAPCTFVYRGASTVYPSC
jgi:hypothetical protein